MTTPPTPTARDLRYRRIEQALTALSDGDLLLVAEVAEGLDARRRERIGGVEIREQDAASVNVVPKSEPVTRVLTTREMLAETTGGAPRHG